MEDRPLLSQIKKKIDYPIITSNIFLNLSLGQVLSYCQSTDIGTVKVCDSPYIWRLYFEKNFTDEYSDYINELIQTLGVDGDKLVNFYHDRIEYMYLRKESPLFADINTIRRDGTDNISQSLLPMYKALPSDLNTVKYWEDDTTEFILKTLADKDFASLYRLLTFKPSKKEDEKEMKESIFYFIVDDYLQWGSERYIPIEFIELVYLKIGRMNDFLKDIYMLYGTPYYMNSINKLSINKNLFYDAVKYYLIYDRNNTFDIISSFEKFSNYYGGVSFEYGKKNKITVYQHTKKNIHPLKVLGDILVYFKMSLRYLGFRESIIAEAVIQIRKHLKARPLKVVDVSDGPRDGH